MSPNPNEKSCDSPSFFAAAFCFEERSLPSTSSVEPNPLSFVESEQSKREKREKLQFKKEREQQQRLESVYSESFLEPILREMPPRQNLASFIASGSSASNRLVKELEGEEVPNKEFFETFLPGSFFMRPTILKFEKGSDSIASSKTKMMALLNETVKRHGLGFLLQNLIIERDKVSWFPAGFSRVKIPINNASFIAGFSEDPTTKDLVANLITDVLMFAFKQRFKDEKEFAPSEGVCEILCGSKKKPRVTNFALQTVFTLEDGSKHEMMFDLFGAPKEEEKTRTATCDKIKDNLDEIKRVVDFFKSRNKEVVFLDINLIDVFFPYSFISQNLSGDKYLECAAKHSPQKASELLITKFIGNLPPKKGIFSDSVKPSSKMRLIPFFIKPNSSVTFGEDVTLHYNEVLDSQIANNFIARAVEEYCSASPLFEKTCKQSVDMDGAALVKELVHMSGKFANQAFVHFVQNFPLAKSISEKEIKMRFIVSFTNFFLANVQEEAEKADKKTLVNFEELANETVVEAFKLQTAIEKNFTI